jgi:hypothetical protein
MDYWLLTDEEKSLILAKVLKDRVVGKANEQGNKEMKRGKKRGNAVVFLVVMMYDEKSFSTTEALCYIGFWTLAHSQNV